MVIMISVTFVYKEHYNGTLWTMNVSGALWQRGTTKRMKCHLHLHNCARNCCFKPSWTAWWKRQSVLTQSKAKYISKPKRAGDWWENLFSSLGGPANQIKSSGPVFLSTSETKLSFNRRHLKVLITPVPQPAVRESLSIHTALKLHLWHSSPQGVVPTDAVARRAVPSTVPTWEEEICKGKKKEQPSLYPWQLITTETTLAWHHYSPPPRHHWRKR